MTGRSACGFGGQRALETARVCLLNATAAGAETLKNLVLPGIGSFITVDGGTVTEADLGASFFVTPEDLGRPRGETVTKWLLELNPDVKGSSLNADPAQLIDQNPQYFHQNQVTLVVAASLTESVAGRLSRILEEQGVPLLLIRPYGLMGFLRIQSPSYSILETFPDQQVEDYHVLNPFPELEKFVTDMGDPDFIEDSMLHAHIPWVCLLVHYLRKWKQSTGWTGTTLSYAQRKEVLGLVAAGKRKQDEENFEEARLAGSKINPPEVPTRLLELLRCKQTDLDDGSTDPFWFCLNALRQFHGQHGRLPLTGKLPDMTATTQWYIALQAVYAGKAQQDIKEMLFCINETIEQLRAKDRPTAEVPTEYVTAFCRNVWHVQAVTFRPYYAELDPSTAQSAVITRGLAADPAHIIWYLLLRASDRFHAAHGRYPGQLSGNPGDASEDHVPLAKALKALCGELSIPSSVDAASSTPLQQWVDYAAADLHTISVMLGGVAAQEAIKLLTRQRVPLNNTLVLNGVACTMATFEL
eukprot:TRINITY_DN15899_c0_g1_i1.p1 TRINITY_DN15899_c0_g1~~TRINITY_DN15899_c0_g1_i1.p1  ORF type:complete len:527 (+),score=99.83 TRINITY_DN15899_c0_g1_i1:81-1661(+)